ncbi:ATP-binding protein [Streptomyces yunnanensis]|uniref:ATP-binding protein n=1 Tax=Streptomyces yunnanensis TaxID=156453 RepID=A0ABY8A489_9ACTN|nr:ATP-binding protein [Streptomyces yunnanensis]WEB39775.1 ATP-binding protein [Streptomyces yunnanensis]
MRQPVRCEERNRRQRADGGHGGGPVAVRAPEVLERKVRQADLKAVGEVRRELRELLGRWAPPDGGAPADPELAALLTSELVTNALLHTEGGAVVTAWVTDRLRVEVRDFAERCPEPRAPSVDGTSGRGLMLVRALADAWGIRPERIGKCVWFELGGGPA